MEEYIKGHVTKIILQSDSGYIVGIFRIKEASNIDGFDVDKAYVKISDDFFEEFSYKTEKVSYEVVIDTLIKCKDVIQYLRDFKLSDGRSVFENAGEVLNWINTEIKKAWEERGEFPGLGAVLYANGLKCGKEIARQLNILIEDKTNYWDKVNDIFNDYKKYFNVIYHKGLHSFIEKRWKKYYVDKELLLFFDLMSRIGLKINNTKYVFDNFIEKRDEIIKNPYRLYELTYNDIDNLISLKKLDYAMLHTDKYTEHNPVNEDSEILGDNDYRRIRAYLMYIIYNETFNGNTIYPLELILKKLYSLRSDIECTISLQDFILDDNDKYFKDKFNF